MNKYTKKEIKNQINQLGSWFHNINLNGVPTNPTKPDYPESRWQLLEPYFPKNMKNKTLLDLGCNAGYFSIKMKEKGAKVLGIDWRKENIEQANFVAKALDLNIEYRQQNIYEFLLTNEQIFDYVIFLGVFYHLRYPLLALDMISKITKEKLYFQTEIKDSNSSKKILQIPDNIRYDQMDMINHPDFPKMNFIEKNLAGVYNNWFVCNSSAVYSILRSSGFRNIIRSGLDCFICEPMKKNPNSDIFTLNWTINYKI